MNKKYNYKNDFEMLYLRHEYLTQIENFDKASLEHYKHIVNKTTYIMFNKFKLNFEKIGFELEDLISISNMYLLAYMGLYSIKNNPQIKEKTIKQYKEKNDVTPTVDDLDKIDQNNLINFLRQRIQHCSTICERKLRNIKVNKEKKAIFAKTKDSIPVDLTILLTDYKKFGYRKVTLKEFKEIKLQARIKNQQQLIDKDGFHVIEVKLYNQGLNSKEYRLIKDDFNDGIHIKTPEEILTQKEQENDILSKQQKFQKLKIQQKRGILLRFIAENKDNNRLKLEVKKARELLKTMRQQEKLKKFIRDNRYNPEKQEKIINYRKIINNSFKKCGIMI